MLVGQPGQQSHACPAQHCLRQRAHARCRHTQQLHKRRHAAGAGRGLSRRDSSERDRLRLRAAATRPPRAARAARNLLHHRRDVVPPTASATSKHGQASTREEDGCQKTCRVRTKYVESQRTSRGIMFAGSIHFLLGSFSAGAATAASAGAAATASAPLPVAAAPEAVASPPDDSAENGRLKQERANDPRMTPANAGCALAAAKGVARTAADPRAAAIAARRRAMLGRTENTESQMHQGNNEKL